MNRSEIIQSVHANIDFFLARWAEFSQWTEDYAAAFDALPQGPPKKVEAARKAADELYLAEIELAKAEVDHADARSLQAEGHESQERVNPLADKMLECYRRVLEMKEIVESRILACFPKGENYVQIGFRDQTFIDNPAEDHPPGWLPPLGRPADLTNPVMWFFGPASLLTDDQQVVRDAVLLAVLHDDCFRDKGAVPLVYLRASYPNGGRFQADRFVESLAERLRPPEAEPEIQTTWERVRPLLQPRPLSERASQVYKILNSLLPHEVMKTSQILDALSNQFDIIMSEDTLRKNILPQLESWGLQHRPGVGYFIRE